MDAVRKMALVPAEFALQPAVQPPQTPVGRELSRLDVEMKKILEDPAIPADVKAKMYTHTLHQHGMVEEGAKKPLELHVKKVKADLTAPSARSIMDSLSHIPAAKKENAHKLATFLESQEDIKWNDRNELMVGGEPILHSNIHDLIDWASRDRTTTTRPRGWHDFYRLLQENNVPALAIGNSAVRAQIGHGVTKVKRRQAEKRTKVKRRQMKKVIKRKFRFENLYK